MKAIDTARFSSQLRMRAIDVQNRRLLVSRLSNSDQEPDLTAPTNCQGFGRVRHFKQATAPGWPTNPLPIVPACRALGIEDVPAVMTAQVFQNAACNWRCWYCYVPFNLLSADESRSLGFGQKSWWLSTERNAIDLKCWTCQADRRI